MGVVSCEKEKEQKMFQKIQASSEVTQYLILSILDEIEQRLRLIEARLNETPSTEKEISRS